VLLEIRTLPRRERMNGVIESGTRIALYEEEPVEPPSPLLQIRSCILNLPIRKYPNPEELETTAQKLLRDVGQLSRDEEQQVRAATARATQAIAYAGMARKYYGQTHVEWPLLGIRIGPIVLLSMPGEPFTEINQEIVDKSPFPYTLFSGYSNGGFGYLPISTATEDGGYEVATSPFASDAGDIVIERSIQLLRELAEDAS
jgi:hypothetical protein